MKINMSDHNTSTMITNQPSLCSQIKQDQCYTKITLKIGTVAQQTVMTNLTWIITLHYFNRPFRRKKKLANWCADFSNKRMLLKLRSTPSKVIPWNTNTSCQPSNRLLRPNSQVHDLPGWYNISVVKRRKSFVKNLLQWATITHWNSYKTNMVTHTASTLGIARNFKVHHKLTVSFYIRTRSLPSRFPENTST